MATRDVICKAIANKKVVTFNYGGGKRIVEFYRSGSNRTTSNKQVRAYQLSGFTNSNELGWKLFDIETISNLKETKKDITFPREGYDAKVQDSDIYTYCQVR